MRGTDFSRYRFLIAATVGIVGIILLAAVISSFIYPKTDDVQTPDADFTFEYSSNSITDSNGTLRVTHVDGASILHEKVSIYFRNGRSVTWPARAASGPENQITVGDSTTVNVTQGYRIWVVYTAGSGTRTTLAKDSRRTATPTATETPSQ
jgi:FlaG/FlaF family flagellin (archaellin)